ncbi:hypothetical protein [Dysgonomonas sp. 511]|uniref:hypothetical protein n=1 Tax=Dysgonomonas sp. 511 TaxID=2302930 RepID=UPI0013D4B233|nr:hypothetical protein [Dysgonomonas sp. 511]NDV79636.1 hypothetical protein [Dysgonomonas sp. 511]
MHFTTYHIVFLLAGAFVLLFYYTQLKGIRQITASKERKLLYGALAAMLVGILARTAFPGYPFGVNMDEAINAYDAWCFANFGTDQYLEAYPVYLKSWGTGQTALYAYLSVPFIKLFGLSTIAHRLPMMLISCFSVLFFYYTLVRIKVSALSVFTIITLVAFSPWHIMKSRWALDCNIAPDLFLIGICCILLGYHALSRGKRLLLFLVGFISFALTAYGYGVAWLMLPFACTGIMIYLYKQQKISLKEILICTIVMAITLLPLALFGYVLFWGGEGFQFGPFHITQLLRDRHSETTFLNNDSLCGYLYDNARAALKMMTLGVDGLRWNALQYWGQFYNLLGLPFIVYCFYRYKKEKQLAVIDILFIIWAVSCLPLMLLVEANVNHWNMLWFPLIYFFSKGWGFATKIYPRTLLPAVVGIFLLMCGFIYDYSKYHQPENIWIYWNDMGFMQHYEEPINYMLELDVDNRFYSTAIDSFSTYGVMFYNPIDPRTYGLDAKNTTKQEHFRKKYFVDSIAPMPRTAYLVPNKDLEQIGDTLFHIQHFELYSVVWYE